MFYEHSPGENKMGRGPDSGLYNIKSFVDLKLKDNKKFTLGRREKDNKSIVELPVNPGPGHYDAAKKTGINAQGKFPSS